MYLNEIMSWKWHVELLQALHIVYARGVSTTFILAMLEIGISYSIWKLNDVVLQSGQMKLFVQQHVIKTCE